MIHHPMFVIYGKAHAQSGRRTFLLIYLLLFITKKADIIYHPISRRVGRVFKQRKQTST